MYDVLPHFVLGFHGCDASVAQKVIAGHDHLQKSTRDWEWLGHGIYFWEQSPLRALQWAQRPGSGIVNPAVVGAVIDLRRCLNLLDATAIAVVQDAYEQLSETVTSANLPMPVNKPHASGSDLVIRYLDCAVIETVHQSKQDNMKPGYDTVRAMFVEGAPLYHDAGFHEKSHIQICVRTADCVKGYFRPLGI